MARPARRVWPVRLGLFALAVVVRVRLVARLLALLRRSATGALRHLDCSHIKLHQHGANPPGGQAAQAIGRTKDGLNTKLAAVV